MKSKCFLLLPVIITVLSQISYAQFEIETVRNPRTGAYERVNNPINQTQVAYEQRQAEMQQEQQNQQSAANTQAINDRYNRRREESNEQVKRSQEFWRDRMRDLQFKTMELNSRINYGTSIIKAGKAKTAFIPSPTFSLKTTLLQSANSPQMKQLVEQYAESSLKKFRDEMKVKGMNSNDMADGAALAFIICYEVFFEQKPSNAILLSTRQKVKEALLKSPLFQSYDDKEHQQQFESYGALTGYAKTLYEKGKADEFALQEAKSHAKSILEALWGNAIHTISLTQNGFIHTGKKIIDEGKATTFFQYNNKINTAEMSVRKDSPFRNDLIKAKRQALEFFYQAVATKGGQKNDLAWCATITAYADFLVLTKGQDWNSAQTASAYNFVKAAILKSQDIQAVSNDVKQIACEQMAIGAATNYINFKKGENATGSVAQANLGELFRTLGEDVNNYQWTTSGIVKVK